MAHNFRYRGNYYVSVDGSDGNDGLTVDTPKRTVQAGLNLIVGSGTTLVIGAGVYEEGLSRTVSSSSTIIGDGEVILQGNGVTSCVFGTNFIPAVRNITFRGYTTVQNNTAGITFLDCTFLNPCSFTGTIVATKCKFINAPVGTISSILYFRYCIFINSSVSRVLSTANTGAYQFVSCYTDPNSSVDFASTATFLTIDCNNLEGFVSMGVVSTVTSGTLFDNLGRQYNLALAGTGGTGTGGDPFKRDNTIYNLFSLQYHLIAYPTFNLRSMDADPKFNSVTNLNFTLQSDSPHINRAHTNSDSIGGTEYAVYTAADSAQLDTNATVVNLTLSSGTYVLSTGIAAGSFVVGYVYKIATVGSTDFTLIGSADNVVGTVFTATGVGAGTGTADAVTGEVISAPIFLQWPITKPLGIIPFHGNLEFDKSKTEGTSGNNNVPDYFTYSNGAGANPDRLSYKMRFSTQQTEPDAANEWDNDGLWTADTYQYFEINKKPKIDYKGLGNGHPDYIEDHDFGDFAPSWIQVGIMLRNNYAL